MIVRKSRYGREARVNVDSLLSFDGVDQYADAGVNPNVINAIDFDKDFAISTFISPFAANKRYRILAAFDKDSSTQQGGFTTTYGQGSGLDGRLVLFLRRGSTFLGFEAFAPPLVAPLTTGHWVINYDASNRRAEFFWNTIPLPTNKHLDTGLNQSIHYKPLELTLGNINDPEFINRENFKGGLGSTLVLNRRITQEEIGSIHRNGNHLSTNELRRACVAHYVPDREGLVLWDVCPQYNYAKTFEAIFSNYGNNSGNVGSGDWLDHNGNPAATIGGTSIRVHTSVGNTYTRNFTPRIGNSGRYTYSFRLETIRIILLLEVVRVSDSQVIFSSTYENISSASQTFDETLEFDTGEEFQIQITRQPSSVSSPSTKLFNDTIQENGFKAYHATLENFTPQQVEGSGQDAYLDFYDKTPLRPFVDSNGDGEYDQPLVEKSSLLPPLQNALRFDAEQNQYASVANFNPTGEQGYTFVLATYFSEPIFNNFSQWVLFSQETGANQNFHIVHRIDSFEIVNRNANNQRHLLGIPVNYRNPVGLVMYVITWSAEGYTIYLRDQKIAEIEFSNSGIYPAWSLDQINAPLLINQFRGASGTTSNYHFSGVAKGIITPRQVIELWNNSLLANPKTSWKNLEWQLLPNFNQISDDGAGNYSLTDNSPQNHTIQQGFTAQNLDSNDPAYSLTEINSLR